MIIQASTDLLPIVTPDTYGTEFQYDVKDEEWENFRKIMVDTAVDYIKEVLKTTDFKEAKIKNISELKSPREYNFNTDWFNFDIEFDDSLIPLIKAKADKDEKFWIWSKENFGSRDGFISFMPYSYGAFMDALEIESDSFSNKDRAVAMWILYQVDKENNRQEMQGDYIDDVVDCANNNGMFIDCEEELYGC